MGTLQHPRVRRCQEGKYAPVRDAAGEESVERHD